MVQAHHQKKQKKNSISDAEQAEVFQKIILQNTAGCACILAESYMTFNIPAVKDVQKTPCNQKIPEDWDNTESVPEFRGCDRPLIKSLLACCLQLQAK